MKKLLFLTFIFFTGCLKNVSHELLVQKDNIIFLNNSDKPYTGKSFITSDDNEIIFEFLYIDGIKKVEKKLFNKNEGLTTVLHQNGNKNTHYEFNRKINHGIKVKGLYQQWYKNNNPKKSGTYKNGNKDGFWTTWYENGQIEVEGNYKDGNKHDLWKFWDKNGEMTTEYFGFSIVRYDWCYPSCNDDVQSSFKFSSDGTFTFSTIMFGGMSRWGNWEEIDDNTFRLTTTRISTNSSNDQLPEPQIVKLISDKKIRVGSTTYVGED